MAAYLLDIIHALSYLIVAIACITAVIILVVYPRLMTGLKLLGVYFVVSASTDLLFQLFNYNKVNNLHLSHYFTLFEFVVLSVAFGQIYRFLGKAKQTKYILYPGLVLILCNSVFIQDLNTYNSYSATFVSFLIIGYSLYFFYLILDKTKQSIQFKALKWGVISIFLFHCVSLVIMFFSNLMLGMAQEKQLMIWSFRALIFLCTKLVLFFQFSRILVHHKKSAF